MIYEVRNQFGNCPYVDGLKDEIVSAHINDKTSVDLDGNSVTILGHEAKDGKTVIKVHIEGI